MSKIIRSEVIVVNHLHTGDVETVWYKLESVTVVRQDHRDPKDRVQVIGSTVAIHGLVLEEDQVGKESKSEEGSEAHSGQDDLP